MFSAKARQPHSPHQTTVFFPKDRGLLPAKAKYLSPHYVSQDKNESPAFAPIDQEPTDAFAAPVGWL